jgi:DNA-binding transcriptional ArsR family regulator
MFLLDFAADFDNIGNMEHMKHGEIVTQLAALAQDTRLALFRLLVEAGPAGLTPGVMAERLEVAAPTLSFHLKELARAGLIRPAQQGRYIVYSADFDTMNALIAYLTENCCRMSCDAECAPAPASERHPSRRTHASKRASTATRRRAS